MIIRIGNVGVYVYVYFECLHWNPAPNQLFSALFLGLYF